MPRQYGAPTGVQAPINTGRQQATPGSAKSYIEHMIEADKAFHASKAKPTPGRSGARLQDTLAKGKPPVGIGGKQREAAVMGAVDKMAK